MILIVADTYARASAGAWSRRISSERWIWVMTAAHQRYLRRCAERGVIFAGVVHADLDTFRRRAS